MKDCYQEIIEELKKNSSYREEKKLQFRASYVGTDKHIYPISTSALRELSKRWIKKSTHLSNQNLFQLLDTLFDGSSYTERSFACKILEYHPNLRLQITPIYIDKWLEKAQGWAEVDALCQSVFSAKDMKEKFLEWKMLLKHLSQNENLHKKRASLVLLIKPLKEVSDIEFADIAFENVERLKREKDPLITKALLWLLRTLLKYHEKNVGSFLKENEKILPRFIVKEIGDKLCQK